MKETIELIIGEIELVKDEETMHFHEFFIKNIKDLKILNNDDFYLDCIEDDYEDKRQRYTDEKYPECELFIKNKDYLICYTHDTDEEFNQLEEERLFKRNILIIEDSIINLGKFFRCRGENEVIYLAKDLNQIISETLQVHFKIKFKLSENSKKMLRDYLNNHLNNLI